MRAVVRLFHNKPYYHNHPSDGCHHRPITGYTSWKRRQPPTSVIAVLASLLLLQWSGPLTSTPVTTLVVVVRAESSSSPSTTDVSSTCASESATIAADTALQDTIPSWSGTCDFQKGGICAINYTTIRDSTGDSYQVACETMGGVVYESDINFDCTNSVMIPVVVNWTSWQSCHGSSCTNNEAYTYIRTDSKDTVEDLGVTCTQTVLQVRIIKRKGNGSSNANDKQNNTTANGTPTTKSNGGRKTHGQDSCACIAAATTILGLFLAAMSICCSH